MPIYDYKCEECEKTYDVFHKVREVLEDVVCPACGSAQHTRLLSAPSFTMGTNQPEAPPCANGGCCSGSCGVN